MNDEDMYFWKILFVVIIFSMFFSVWTFYRDFQWWKAFADQHNCKVVKETSGATQWRLVGKTLVPIKGPPTTTYLCDDGKKYTR